MTQPGIVEDVARKTLILYFCHVISCKLEKFLERYKILFDSIVCFNTADYILSKPLIIFHLSIFQTSTLKIWYICYKLFLGRST
jgi:hypothetical protein